MGAWEREGEAAHAARAFNRRGSQRTECDGRGIPRPSQMNNTTFTETADAVRATEAPERRGRRLADVEREEAEVRAKRRGSKAEECRSNPVTAPCFGSSEAPDIFAARPYRPTTMNLPVGFP